MLSNEIVKPFRSFGFILNLCYNSDFSNGADGYEFTVGVVI